MECEYQETGEFSLKSFYLFPSYPYAGVLCKTTKW